jgi:hypothetical protein
VLLRSGAPADSDGVRLKLSIAAAAAVGTAVCAAGVVAAPTPLSPAPGSSTTSTHPTFRWTVKAPEVADSISIAKSPGLAATGEFVTANIVDVADLEQDATSWSPTRALPAGVYWWHVGSRDTTDGAPPQSLFTPAMKLTVRVSIAVQSLKLKWAGRQFLATVSLRANVSKVGVLVQLYSGSRLLGSHRATTSNFLIDQPTDDQSMWTIPGAVKHGAPLRLVTTLTVPGQAAKTTASKTFRVP